MDTSKKAFKGMLIVIAASAALSIGLFYITDQNLQKRSKEISELRAQEEISQQQITIYEDARKKIDELAYIDELAQEVLPTSKDQANVIAEIRGFGIKSGVSVDTISFNGVTTQGDNLDLSQTKEFEGVSGVRILPAQLLLAPDASYNSLLQFLERIEQNRRKIQVVGLSLTPNPENRTTFSTITIDINIFLKGE